MDTRMLAASRAFITSGISEGPMAVEGGGSVHAMPDWYDPYLARDIRKDVADAVSFLL